MLPFSSNATVKVLGNQTQDYFTVLDTVTKYNVQLNFLERLWAVRLPYPFRHRRAHSRPRHVREEQARETKG